MAVPANEEVADGRKMSNLGKGGSKGKGYIFQLKGDKMYDFTYKDFIFNGKQKGDTNYDFMYKDFIFNGNPKGDTNYDFTYKDFILNGKEKGLRFDKEKMVRLLIFLLQGLINNYDILCNSQIAKGVHYFSNTFALFPVEAGGSS